MGKANETDGSARSGHVNRHVHGFQCADALQDRFGPAMRLLTHLLYCLLISGRNEIGGPKYLPQVQPRFLVSDEKDAFGSQVVGSQDATESDGPIANHGHRAACSDPCGESSVMACRHDIGEREDGLEQLLIAFHALGNHDQGAVSVGDANGFGLAAIIRTAPALSMHA